MLENPVVRFLRVQHAIINSQATLKHVDRKEKTRGDVQKILWELQEEMRIIDAFFITPTNSSGIDGSELEWLEKVYERAEKKRYEMAGMKS